MKKYAMISVLLLACVLARGQWLDSNVYDRPLEDVLTEIGRRYDVRLVYEQKNVRDKVVEKAPWKFYDDVEATLDNVLRPLEMRWTKKSTGVYEIKKWEYYRKPFDEGRKHLERLSASYPSLEQWEVRKALLRRTILEAQGLDGLKKCPLEPIRSNLRHHDGYSVENMALEVLPGVWVCGSLYMPAKFKGRIPAMLCPHGHFYNSVDNSIPDERGRYRPDQQIRCAVLARMGIAVFSYDMFGWGESAIAFTQKEHRTDLGLTMQTWQSIRILDWFCEQPWVDTARVGVTGASGGGTQTMFIAAVDDRITLSVPVVMCASHFFGGCPCESGLPIHFPPDAPQSNNAEFAAMAAPRPQLIVSDGGDWTTTVPEIEFPYLRKVYALYGKKNAVENVHLAKEKHDYGPGKRAAMYDFVARHFGLKPPATDCESSVAIEPALEMYVFGADRQLPGDAVRGGAALGKLLKSYR